MIGLFQDETIIADERNLTAEQHLLVALLERAVRDYLGNRPQERRDAAEWLFDQENNNEEFSFHWICEQLDLDHHGLDKRIRNMTPRGDVPAQAWWRSGTNG